MFYAKKPLNLAEREGFEPSVPVTQYARLAIYFRPANTRTLARLLETENPCGSATCRIRAVEKCLIESRQILFSPGSFPHPVPTRSLF